MANNKLILVTGGARSGKSSFAEKLAREAGKDVTYVATAQPLDEEMAKRIYEHKRSRPQNWKTVEEPLNVAPVIEQESKRGNVILLDCLALFVANVLLAQEDPTGEKASQKILCEIEKLATTCKKAQGEVIIVTNEVGMGIVPEYPISRTYRDLLGKANQIMASYADIVYLMVCGIPIDLKSLNRALAEGATEGQ